MTSRDELKARIFREIEETEVVELLRRAVRTPSVTTDEAAMGRLLEEELRGSGLDQVECFEFAPGRPNVWGVRRGSGGGRRLMFAGHTDTVDVAGWGERWRGTSREDPFGGVVEEGAVWGRGAADMKGGSSPVWRRCGRSGGPGSRCGGTWSSRLPATRSRGFPDRGGARG